MVRFINYFSVVENMFSHYTGLIRLTIGPFYCIKNPSLFKDINLNLIMDLKLLKN